MAVTTARLVLWAVAGILGYLAYGQARAAHRGRARWIRGLAAPATRVGDVVEMAAAARAQLGPGAFRQVVTLTGTVEGETRPAPVSGTDSVWYRVRTIRRFNTNDGSDTEVVGDQRSYGTFRLGEGATHVIVDPADATVDLAASARRQRGPDPDEGISIGSLRIGGRTIGYEDTEWRIGVGQQITVIGEARDTGSGVLVTVGPGQSLVLTAASRSDHLDGQRHGARAALLRAVGYAGVAVAVVVLSAFV